MFVDIKWLSSVLIYARKVEYTTYYCEILFIKIYIIFVDIPPVLHMRIESHAFFSIIFIINHHRPIEQF